MQFNKDLIEQIKAANPIEDVVQLWMDEHGMPMKHSGGTIFAHHHVWRPAADAGTALWVTPANQMWHCFSCKQGGDVIHLVQSFMYGDDYEQRNVGQLTEALKWLAERAGITYDPTSEFDPEYLELRIIYGIYSDFIDYCIKNCNREKYKQETLNIIQNRYPLTEETIEKFKITVFRREWTAPFYHKLLEKYTHEELIASGLWREYKDDVSCMFQGRMIIPYIQNGDVVYLIARETFLSGFNDENDQWVNYDRGAKFKKIPKYVEDKEYTHGISKLVRNDYVFGADYIKKGTDIIITEGIGDCLVLLQAGFHAISPVTTSFKNEMLEPVANRLMRVRQIYIANDNEESKGGQLGAERMHQFFLGKGLDAKIVTLPRPEGLNKIDVAEYFKDHTVDDFKDLLTKAESILHLQIQSLTPSAHRLDIEKIWEKILNMPNYERMVYEDRLAKQLGFKSVNKLKETFGGKRRGAITKELIFEAPSRIVPGMDFLKDEDGSRVAHLTTFIPTKEDKDDGKTDVVILPFLLSNEINLDGKEKLQIRDLMADPLSDVEMDRLPDESIVFSRWRFDAKYPFSLSNYINTDVRKKPSIDAVFHEIYSLYDEYFWYPHEYEKTVQTLYIILSYFYQIFSAVPGLHLTGQKNSGKSNSMKIMTETAFNAIYSLEARAPFIFRGSHNNRSLLILDEGEQYTGESLDAEKAAILNILRGRYKKGTNVPRTEKNAAGKMVQNMYDAFGPLVVGSIAHLEDAFSSRMIIVECLTKGENDGIQIKKFDEEIIIPKCHDIRDKLYTLMLSDFPAVWKSFEHMKNDPRIKHIDNREWEKWLPMFTIAHWIDTASRHTKKSLVADLLPVQAHKEQIRHDSEISLNKELIVLQCVEFVLTGGKPDHTFKILDIGDGNLAIPSDRFYAKLNDRMRDLQIQKAFDMQTRGYFENVLRKTQVWRAGEGLVDANSRLIINIDRLKVAIKRILQ